MVARGLLVGNASLEAAPRVCLSNPSAGGRWNVCVVVAIARHAFSYMVLSIDELNVVLYQQGLRRSGRIFPDRFDSLLFRSLELCQRVWSPTIQQSNNRFKKAKTTQKQTCRAMEATACQHLKALHHSCVLSLSTGRIAAAASAGTERPVRSDAVTGGNVW